MGRPPPSGRHSPMRRPETFPMLPPRAVLGRSALRLAPPQALLAAAALIALAALAGCAKSGDVDKVEQENRVQDQRLRALEEGMSGALREQFAKMNKEMADLKARLDGQSATITERLDQISAEQRRVTEQVDGNTAHARRIDRRLDEQNKAYLTFRTDSENELDKLRLRMKDVEALLKTPIAGLPATTEPDKLYRDAFFLLISGQLDVAIDRFGQFMQQYPKEPRRAEALFRQGQAYFLLRKYDYALVPLFEILDKFPQSKFVIEARWLLARSLEETGDLKLARDFYAQLITGKTVYSADASRRVAYMNKLLPAGAEPAKAEPAKTPAPPAKPDKPEKGDKAEKPDKPAKPEPASKP